ncbi:quinone oxidoreductase family protein [Legionella longbeachae]|uniref:quinone oxidoreductase family protein n=1 Tax=Legionella longbeachae TaxID=450 RepID=UPI001247D535|nr:zinc-binding alcohol dehydrogenase family protein [Legionella longbeachae]QEY50961.1 zinc-binding alcohol dehydrogenase family protein [Legionella longbeachae]QIN31738.1 zinc-binding dehydrogenase [Legionella longbeachae]
MKVEAWILERAPKPALLKKGTIELASLNADSVLVEPLYGCWEGNMGHALKRNPIDICAARNEDRVVIGNAGVVRALKTGNSASSIIPGEIYILFSGDTGSLPRFNYPLKAHGYDSHGTVGLLAKQTIVHYKQLLPIPENTRFSLLQWAAFSLRYITAWGNWKVASQTYRAMVSEKEEPNPSVWGWGGGVSLAILQLAKAAGYKTALIASNSSRLNLIEQLGITAIDRNSFLRLNSHLEWDPSSKKFSEEYVQAEKSFLQLVKEYTNGYGVSVFVDLIGEPILKATIKALSRPGVLTTAGWKEGMHVSYLRALACMQWHAYIHTHYASLTDAYDAIRYAEQNAWLPPLEPQQKIYSWEEINLLAEDYLNGHTDYFPLFSIQAC